MEISNIDQEKYLHRKNELIIEKESKKIKYLRNVKEITFKVLKNQMYIVNIIHMEKSRKELKIIIPEIKNEPFEENTMRNNSITKIVKEKDLTYQPEELNMVVNVYNINRNKIIVNYTYKRYKNKCTSKEYEEKLRKNNIYVVKEKSMYHEIYSSTYKTYKTNRTYKIKENEIKVEKETETKVQIEHKVQETETEKSEIEKYKDKNIKDKEKILQKNIKEKTKIQECLYILHINIQRIVYSLKPSLERNILIKLIECKDYKRLNDELNNLNNEIKLISNILNK